MTKNSITAGATGLFLIALLTLAPLHVYAESVSSDSLSTPKASATLSSSPRTTSSPKGERDALERSVKVQSELERRMKNLDKNASKAAEKFQKAESRLSSRAAELEDRNASRAAKLEQRKVELLNRFAEHSDRRLNAATKRQENILGRINSRLTKLETEKRKNVATLRAQASAAATLITKQKTDITALETLYRKADKTEADYAAIKTAQQAIITEIKATQKALIDLVVGIARLEGLKLGQSSSSPVASTTTSATPRATTVPNSTASASPDNL